MPISFSSFYLHFLGFLAVSTLVWSDTEPSKRGKPVLSSVYIFRFVFKPRAFVWVFCERFCDDTYFWKYSIYFLPFDNKSGVDKSSVLVFNRR